MDVASSVWDSRNMALVQVLFQADVVEPADRERMFVSHGVVWRPLASSLFVGAGSVRHQDLPQMPQRNGPGSGVDLYISANEMHVA